MSRILHVTTKLPVPPDDGGRIASWNLARCLRYNGHDLDLVCFVGSREDPERHRERLSAVYSSVDAVLLDVERQYAGSLLRAWLTGTSYFVRKFRSREMARRIEAAATSVAYDSVWVDFAHMGVYLPELRRGAAVPVLLRAHNVEHEILERGARRERSGWVRAILRREAPRFRRFEEGLIREVDEVLAISHRDAAVFRKAGARTVRVLEAMIDVDELAEGPDPPILSGSLVTVANLSWRPNVNGVLWFHRRVWPRVRERHAEVTWTIVGKHPPQCIRRLEGPGIRVTGGVPDVRPYVRTAHLLLVPLHEGSGVRIKILEGMAMGARILTTPIGAEGIEWPGLLIRGAVEEWIETIDAVLARPPSRDAAAVEHVRRHHDWKRAIRWI